MRGFLAAAAVLLLAAGAAQAVNYTPTAHGFASFTGVAPGADTACREIAGLVREAYEGRLV